MPPGVHLQLLLLVVLDLGRLRGNGAGVSAESAVARNKRLEGGGEARRTR